MHSSVAVKIDLSTIGGTRSVSQGIDVPEWARTVSVFPRASTWGSGPSIVDLESGGGQGDYAAMNTPVFFIDNTPQRRVPIAGDAAIRLRTTTAGGGSPSTDAEFVIVFSDAE